MRPAKNTIKRFLDRHFLNRINKIDSYIEVPKVFRQRGFREQMYDRYSEMGQFFSIKSPEELYLVLLKDNGVVVAMSSMMEEVDPSDIEYDLNLNLFDIGLKDVLEDYIQDQSSEMKTLKGMTESFISRLVKRIINEDNQQRFAYGGEEIRKLDSQLGPDEYVQLSDYSDQLRGDIVKKKDYVIHMLRGAIKDEDWGKVGDTILFIKHKM
jgi:hypothetical protein